MSGTTAAVKTYRGNCHCGAFIFELTTAPIETAASCNCSSCIKKACMWLPLLDEGALTVVKDEGKLAEYTCGPRGSTHKVPHPLYGYNTSVVLGLICFPFRAQFCSVCGISVLATNPGPLEESGTAINVSFGRLRH